MLGPYIAAALAFPTIAFLLLFFFMPILVLVKLLLL